MKTPSSPAACGRVWPARLALLGLLTLPAGAPLFAASAPFGVPVRVSFKFILNNLGNRPATGELNTDAEIEAQVARGNQILAAWTSELRVHNVEIVDVAGHSEWYNATTDDRDAIRAAAIANPAGYAWRNNAVNVYITANTGCSARSQFPPDNDIIIVCQSIYDTTVMHELGHSLNLYHTHQSGGNDGCADTLPDNEDWTRDQIATNAYGMVYALLNASQQYQVNMVWSNLMSYHNGDHRWMMSSCQLDRVSTQASSDQTWLLTKRPVYVDGGYAGTQNGTFPQPYTTIQNAINAGVLNSRVLVLDQGTHDNPSSAITTATDVVPRKGSATVREAKLPYDLPANLEESKNPRVREAVVRAQFADRQRDVLSVITHLLEAEQHATGRERDALRLELAQRYRDLERFDEAGAWFEKAAAGADQPGLKRRAREKADAMKAELKRQKQLQDEGEENDDKRNEKQAEKKGNP